MVVDRISITDRINQLVDLLESGQGTIQFDDLIGRDLPEAELRHKVVVSLLAVLELARLRVVRILQQEASGAFFLARVEGAGLAEARNLTVTSVKDESRGEAPAGRRARSRPARPASADPHAAPDDDTARHLSQDDVVSAPPPASADAGQDASDGQTKAEQKDRGE